METFSAMLGIVVSLLHDGLKTTSVWYDQQRAGVKHLVYWVLVVLAVFLLRAFNVPDTFTGWLWLAVTVVAVGLVGEGFFRWRKSLAVNRFPNGGHQRG